MRKLIPLLLTVLILCSAILTGCGSTPETSSSEPASTASSEGQSESVAYPITVSHIYGETVIESKPQRVVSIAWENSAAPLALGLAPVGVAEANYGLVIEHKIHPWTDETCLYSLFFYPSSSAFHFRKLSSLMACSILQASSSASFSSTPAAISWRVKNWCRS